MNKIAIEAILPSLIITGGIIGVYLTLVYIIPFLWKKLMISKYDEGFTFKKVCYLLLTKMYNPKKYITIGNVYLPILCIVFLELFIADATIAPKVTIVIAYICGLLYISIFLSSLIQVISEIRKEIRSDI